MNTAELLINCLMAQGVDIIYGVPGEENADVMMALAKKKLNFMTCRHEQTASFMAEMHGRLTGKPGICLSTLGPGVTNLLTGVAQATFDGAPLIALVGQCSTHRSHKLSHQNINAMAMLRPVVKWAYSIPSPDVVPEIVAKAFKIATSDYPGAVALELPEDIASLACTRTLKPLILPKPASVELTHHAIHAFLALLKDSRCPMVLLGEGAVRTQADNSVREFLEKTGLYCAYTFMGKGCIPHQHPRSLHCAGLGFHDVVLKAFSKADLVICIGYEQIEWAPSVWNHGTSKKIIHLQTHAAEVDSAFIPNLEVIGWIPSLMASINQHVTKGMKRTQPYLGPIQQGIEKDLHQDREDLRCPMTPKSILNILRTHLNAEAMLISDVGAHKMWIARQYGATHSNTCLISNGFCSMGGSIPGAVEAKRLYPKRQIVAVCGDGGFVMSIQALFTGVMYKIPCVVMVWQDNAYGLISWKQEMHFAREAFNALVNPDLAQLAKAIGCHARTIQQATDLAPALAWALSNKKAPTVLVIPVDYSENMRLFHHLNKKGV